MAEQSESPGYIFETVDPLPSEYVCPICQNILYEPQQIATCGHRFCQACLERVRRMKPSLCPLDRKQIKFDKVFSDKACKRKVLSLQVKCCNSSQGCPWTGELRYAQKHLDACPLEKIKCPNENCKEMIERRNVETHSRDSCTWRKMTCQLCNEDYVYCQEQDHMDLCQLAPIACLQGCDILTPSREMTDHINIQCPMTIVECPYSDVGCEVKMKRCELDDHLDNSKMLHKMYQENKELKGKWDNIKKRLNAQEEQLEKKNDNLIKQLAAQQKQLQKFKDDLRQLSDQVKQRNLEMNRESNTLENTFNEKLHNQESQINEIQDVKERLRKQENQINEIQDVKKRLRKKENQFKERLPKQEKLLKDLRDDMRDADERQIELNGAVVDVQIRLYNQEQKVLRYLKQCHKQEERVNAIGLFMVTLILAYLVIVPADKSLTYNIKKSLEGSMLMEMIESLLHLEKQVPQSEQEIKNGKKSLHEQNKRIRELEERLKQMELQICDLYKRLARQEKQLQEFEDVKRRVNEQAKQLSRQDKQLQELTDE